MMFKRHAIAALSRTRAFGSTPLKFDEVSRFGARIVGMIERGVTSGSPQALAWSTP
jgi:hypothetical protein